MAVEGIAGQLEPWLLVLYKLRARPSRPARVRWLNGARPKGGFQGSSQRSEIECRSSGEELHWLGSGAPRSVD